MTDNIIFYEYQRYKTVQIVVNKLKSLNGLASMKILEINSDNNKTIEKFLCEDNVNFLGIKSYAEIINLVHTHDDEFDFIFSHGFCDKISPDARKKFLTEMQRISKFGVLLYTNLDDCSSQNFDGIIEIIKSENAFYKIIEHGELSLHKKMKSCTLQNKISDLQRISTYYNENVFISDIGETNFRKFILYAKDTKIIKAFHEPIFTATENNVNLNQLNNIIEYLCNTQDSKAIHSPNLPKSSNLLIEKTKRVKSLIAKAFASVKNDGVKITAHKIKMRFSNKSKLPEHIDFNVAKNVKSITDFIKICKDNGASFFCNRNAFSSEAGRKILFVSHVLNLTGAPIALLNWAIGAKNSGDTVLLVGPFDDALRKTATDNDIPVLCMNKPLCQTSSITNFAHIFDYIVANTTECAPIVSSLNGHKTPVIWWIHESHTSYHDDALKLMPKYLDSNIKVYAVGEYARKILLSYRPNYEVGLHLYYIPQMIKSTQPYPLDIKKIEDKYIFACVGVLQLRKAQDILAKAIRMLSPNDLGKCVFVIVGKKHDTQIVLAVESLAKDFPDNVLYIESIPPSDMGAFYENVDCLICPSKDDPMPIVITEALQLSKPVICSENTGYAPILKELNSGLVYENDDPAKLSECITKAINSDTIVSDMTKNAYKTYDELFSIKAFANSAEKIYAEDFASDMTLPFNEYVSVIIPTFCAGDEFESLICSLQKQKNIGNLEIIIVDSESKDDTVLIAQKMGVRVINIKQSEFSHSYARNLGAENANGDYLLFMTQDAMPSDDNWICKLARKIITDDVVAVSPKQIPRSDCDIFGAISVDMHTRYMQISEYDRVLSMPNDENIDNLRRNAQLDDVSCLIKKSVFMQYKYKNDYAEDLELGLNLIKNNYKLALSSIAPVIHSHNRSALYHFKRNIVDFVMLTQILSGVHVEPVLKKALFDKILTAFVLFYTASENTQISEFEKCNCSEIQVTINKLKKTISFTNFDFDKVKANAYFQEDFLQMIIKLHELSESNLSLDFTICDNVIQFIGEINNYLASNPSFHANVNNVEIFSCLVKKFASTSGNLLASYKVSVDKPDMEINKFISNYTTGI